MRLRRVATVRRSATQAESVGRKAVPLVSISHPLAVSMMHSREFLLKSGIDSVS